MSNLSGPKASVTGKKKQLAPRFEKMVAAYATAAGAAAGVALLTASPAEAKVVYTQTRKTITSSLPLDLNHDGIPDFDINFVMVNHGALLQVSLETPGNLVRDQANSLGEAAALLFGAPIGPKQSFTSSTFGYGGVAMAFASGYGSQTFSNGPWVHVKNRYLGLKFLVNGQVHFGWARLSVTRHLDQVILTGYAYETIPNKALRAGQTSEPTASEASKTTPLPDFVPQLPSLGLLACGAEGLDIWRRSPQSTTIL